MSRSLVAAFAVLAVVGAALAPPKAAFAAEEPASAKSAAPESSALTSAATTETPEQTLESGAGLVSRARAALRSLERIRNRATNPELERLQTEISDRRDEFEERVKQANEDARRARRRFELRDIRFSLLEDRRRIAEWQEIVTRANQELTASRKHTNDLLQFWERANRLAVQGKAPAAVRERTRDVVVAANATELALAKPEAVLIPLQSTLTEMSEMVNALLEETRTGGPSLLNDPHRRDFSVMQAMDSLGELGNAPSTVRETAARMLEASKLFLSSARKQLLAHVVFTFFVLFGLVVMRARSRSWDFAERDGEVARRIVEHPIAGALQLGTLGSLFIYEELPTVAVLVLYVIALGSSVVLWLKLLGPRLWPLGYIIGGFVSLDVVRIVLHDLVHVERLILLVELIALTLILAVLLRKQRLDGVASSALGGSVVRGIAWLWLLGAGIGAVGGCFGYGHLAEIVGGGVLVSIYFAPLYAGLVQALRSTVWVIVRADWPQRLNVVRSYRELVVAKLSTAFTLIGFLLWLRGSLKALTLFDSVQQTAAAVLATKFEVGELKISLGGVLVLVFGTLLAVWLARALRFVLDEDVLGRLDMNPGTREVSASGIFWAAILIGFFAVLAAAGIALDKLTVLAGAFGVGIGFGLQNVVQNFAAGLILLFGRPIKVGDQIQLEGLLGEVRSIGFRASTVRTPQGAEVIVPNANLISNQVINWTLSDPKRRVEINIGVAYGVDPDRIVELLCDVGRSHEKVLKEPPSVALFMNHGESSLDFQLRVWVLFDDFVPVSSELAIAVNKRLTAEGIEIPFPQRDLNLRSVAPAVAKALGNRS